MAIMRKPGLTSSLFALTSSAPVTSQGHAGTLTAVVKTVAPATPFRVPAGMRLIRVDAKSGTRAGPTGDGRETILEAFKPGTAPPDETSMFGVADADPRPPAMVPDYERTIMRPGTGGLY